MSEYGMPRSNVESTILEPRRALATFLQRHNPRVLVVDPNVARLGAISNYLLDANYGPFLAVQGDTALEKLREVKPQLAIVNTSLDGPVSFSTFVETVRSERNGNPLKIIAISDHDGDNMDRYLSNLENSKNYPVIGHLRTPLDKSSLIKLIQEAIPIQNKTLKNQRFPNLP